MEPKLSFPCITFASLTYFVILNFQWLNPILEKPLPWLQYSSCLCFLSVIQAQQVSLSLSLSHLIITICFLLSTNWSIYIYHLLTNRKLKSCLFSALGTFSYHCLRLYIWSLNLEKLYCFLYYNDEHIERKEKNIYQFTLI